MNESSTNAYEGSLFFFQIDKYVRQAEELQLAATDEVHRLIADYRTSVIEFLNDFPDPNFCDSTFDYDRYSAGIEALAGAASDIGTSLSEKRDAAIRRDVSQNETAEPAKPKVAAPATPPPRRDCDWGRLHGRDPSLPRGTRAIPENNAVPRGYTGY